MSLWDTRYSGDGFMYGTEPNDFLRERVGVFTPGGAVLSLGEGEGRNAVFLATRGLKVTGVDGSAVGLKKAQALAAAKGVTVSTVVADLSGYDLGEAQWAGVLSVWCHLPQALRPGLHQRVVRALNPGGVVFFEHYHPKQLAYKTGGPPEASMMLTLDELRGAFAGFTVEHAFEGEREVKEGVGHSGKSFVTQFIARKP